VVALAEIFADVEPDEVGGGMVDRVWLDRYEISDRMPDREEAGTPNIAGAIGLAAALHALSRIGMENVLAEEQRLMQYALRELASVPRLVIYGDRDETAHERAGAISFNLDGIDHALTAAILNDYHNIAVRNECFCAHPYVREMIMFALERVAGEISNEELERRAEAQRGMVRASFGIYTTTDDVDRLVGALKHIVAEEGKLTAEYERMPNGDYRHRSFRPDLADLFSPQTIIDEMLHGRAHESGQDSRA
jgi:selenocysteine lyase/cysteine desulfurase